MNFCKFENLCVQGGAVVMIALSRFSFSFQCGLQTSAIKGNEGYFGETVEGV